MKNIIYKYTEKIANKKAQAIERFVRKIIPSWQVEIMLRFLFTRKFFGWRIEQYENNLEKGRFLTRVNLYRWKKPIDTLMISIRIKTKE